MFANLSKKTLISIVAVVIALTAVSETAFGYTHNFINSMRSSTERHIYVSQAVEAEYGTFTLTDQDGVATSNIWNGYGFRNAVGMEFIKFIQFSANHTFLNMNNKDSSSSRLGGSRLAGEVKFSFASPLGNLEMGAGAIVSRYDLQQQLDHTSIYGSGMYYTMGVNYFVSSQISLFGNMKSINEHFVRNAGASIGSGITTSTTSAGFGASIWL